MAGHGRIMGRELAPQSLGYKLRRLQLSYNRYFTQTAPKATLPARQLGSLALIARNPGLTPSELKNLLVLDAAQLSVILRRLEKRAFIRREKSTLDSRSYHLHITSEGAAEYSRIQDVIRKVEEGFVGDALDAGERATLFDMLDRLLAGREA